MYLKKEGEGWRTANILSHHSFYGTDPAERRYRHGGDPNGWTGRCLSRWYRQRHGPRLPSPCRSSAPDRQDWRVYDWPSHGTCSRPWTPHSASPSNYLRI